MRSHFSKLSLPLFILLFLASFLVPPIALSFFVKATQGTEGLKFLQDNQVIISFLVSLLSYTAMVLLIWYGRVEAQDRAAILAKAPGLVPSSPWMFLAPMLLLVPVSMVYVPLLQKFLPEFYDKMSQAGNLPANFLTSLEPMELILMSIVAVVLAPLVEELMFRGVLFNLLAQDMPTGLALVLSSLAFGLLHGTTFFQTTVMGLCLGLIYHFTGSLRMAIGAHFFNNAQALLFAMLITGQAGETTNLQLYLGLALSLVSIVYLIFTIGYWRRHQAGRFLRAQAPLNRNS